MSKGKKLIDSLCERDIKTVIEEYISSDVYIYMDDVQDEMAIVIQLIKKVSRFTRSIWTESFCYEQKTRRSNTIFSRKETVKKENRFISLIQLL